MRLANRRNDKDSAHTPERREKIDSQRVELRGQKDRKRIQRALLTPFVRRNLAWSEPRRCNGAPAYSYLHFNKYILPRMYVMCTPTSTFQVRLPNYVTLWNLTWFWQVWKTKRVYEYTRIIYCTPGYIETIVKSNYIYVTKRFVNFHTKHNIQGSLFKAGSVFAQTGSDVIWITLFVGLYLYPWARMIRQVCDEQLLYYLGLQ